MSDFVYNPATGYFEQFQGDVPDPAPRAISNVDAATHHALVNSLPVTETVTCDTCGQVYADWNQCEYIGWNGQCVACDVKEWEAESSRTVGGLFEFEDFEL